MLAPSDRAYFRESRERRFGMPLERVSADREERVQAFRRDVLHPLRVSLEQRPWLGGASPLYADYIVFGAFQWARVCSPFELLAGDDPVAAWRNRMLNLYGGLARATPARAETVAAEASP